MQHFLGFIPGRAQQTLWDMGIKLGLCEDKAKPYPLYHLSGLFLVISEEKNKTMVIMQIEEKKCPPVYLSSPICTVSGV